MVGGNLCTAAPKPPLYPLSSRSVSHLHGLSRQRGALDFCSALPSREDLLPTPAWEGPCSWKPGATPSGCISGQHLNRAPQTPAPANRGCATEGREPGQGLEPGERRPNSYRSTRPHCRSQGRVDRPQACHGCRCSCGTGGGTALGSLLGTALRQEAALAFPAC